MNLPAALYAIRWLVRDTFRQSLASRLFWIMLAVSALCVLACLSVRVEGDVQLRRRDEPSEFLPRKDPQVSQAKRHGVDVIGGQVSLLFGAMPVALGRDRDDAVRFLQLLLAGGVADSLGLLLALVWTAGFLPAFLEPGAVAVLLAKPAPRWSLLVGKYLGVLVFVLFQATVFVVGTWLALGLRTGVWGPFVGTTPLPVYLMCIPVLLVHFAIFYSFSTLLATMTRSTVACVFGSLVFWLLCWGMNYARHKALIDPELAALPAPFHATVEAAYWVTPKPADMGILLFEALQARDHFAMMEEVERVRQMGAFHPELSLLASLLFAAVTLFAAARQFATTDY
jgi:ABC-type transport system involved in multi-copper enzyme maturation permease subunit